MSPVQRQKYIAQAEGAVQQNQLLGTPAYLFAALLALNDRMAALEGTAQPEPAPAPAPAPVAPPAPALAPVVVAPVVAAPITGPLG